MRDETERQDVRHQWRRENQDKHKAHEKRHLASECARSLLASSCCRHTHSLHTTSRGSSCPRVCAYLIHAWSERHSATLSSPFHPTSSTSYSLSISRRSCCPWTSTRTRSNTLYSANKKMEFTNESYSQTHPIVILMFRAHGEWSLRLLHTLHLLSLHLSYLLALPAPLHPLLPQCLGWKSPRTSTEELGTMAERNFSKVWVRTHPFSCFMSHLVWLSDCILFDNSVHFFFLTIFFLSFFLPVKFIFQARSLRTLAPSHDCHITEACGCECVPKTSRSLSRRRFVVLSSSVSHDRTVKPIVAPFDSQVSSV